MWRDPYICFLILVLCPSWFQTLWFCTLCAGVVFSVMWLVCRVRVRAIRARADERLAEQTHIARELHDNMLQIVQGSKFVADDALEKSSDSAHMRLALERLSNWLGHATLEAQAALESLPALTIEHNDN